jgi:hypothetical protein
MFDMEVDDITSDFTHDVFLFSGLDLLFFTCCKRLSSLRESLSIREFCDVSHGGCSTSNIVCVSTQI